MNFADVYAEKKRVADGLIDSLCDELKLVEPLCSAVKYSLKGGGKRLRPVLFLEGCKIFCKNLPSGTSELACAVECIHTYSLIHDDLPCMDDDDYRRGKPTCHKVFGEANAVLAGDSLLNLAYELMIKAALNGDERVLEASRILSRAAGGEGMVGGQVIDLSDVKKDASAIKEIYEKKTAALIRAAVCAGAIMGGADEEEISAIDGFGYNFGMSFQLSDDILDAEEGDEPDKNTFIHVFGREKTEKELECYVEKAIKALQSIKGRYTSFLQALAVNFIKRKE